MTAADKKMIVFRNIRQCAAKKNPFSFCLKRDSLLIKPLQLSLAMEFDFSVNPRKFHVLVSNDLRHSSTILRLVCILNCSSMTSRSNMLPHF